MHVCIYTHIYTYECMYVSAHIYTIKCRLPESVFHLGILYWSQSSSRDACIVAEGGPEWAREPELPPRVQQTLVTSAVTFSHLQLWPQGSEPVSQPSSWLLGRPFIYLCFNENKLGFSHSPR